MLNKDKEIVSRIIELSDKKDYGIFPPCTDAQVAFNELCRFFLGEDFYVVTPICNEQCNTELLYEIEKRYKNSLIRKIYTKK